jgi:hypothetical protein
MILIWLLKADMIKQSIYAGLILFGICLLGMILNFGALVVILSHFLPGLIIGYLIILSITHQVSDAKKLLFIFLSTGIHIACVFFVDVFSDHEIWTPIKLIIASSVGALLLTLAYDLLIVKTVSFIDSFLLPFTTGIIASTLSALSIYYILQVGFEQNVLEGFLWAGIFSIFPIWYYLLARLIKTRHKTTS